MPYPNYGVDNKKGCVHITVQRVHILYSKGEQPLSLVHMCDANANARANDVHTSNSNATLTRYAGAVKDSQTFSKMAVKSEALASGSLLFVVFQYRVLKGRKQ